MSYVVKLGVPGSLRSYTLKQQGQGVAWQQGPADPFAATVNASGDFDKVDVWNELALTDYQAGVGKTDPADGGFLYSDAETRIPNQLILSPLIRQVDTRDLTAAITDCRFMPDNMVGEITVGGTGTNAVVAMKFTTPGTLVYSLIYYWVYAQVDSSVELTYLIYTDSSGPSALVTSGVYTPADSTPGWYWHGKSLAGFGTLATNTSYWLAIKPTSSSKSFKVGYGSSGYATVMKQYNGVSWADVTSTYMLFTSQHHHVAVTQSNAGAGFFRFNSNLYCFSNTRIYKYSVANDNWVYTVGNGTSWYSITGATTWDSKVWFGSGGLLVDDAFTMNTSEVLADSTFDGNIFVKYGPYLYRALDNDIYLSADGASWSGPYEVGSDEFVITGMAGMGDSLYVATAEALYRFAPGNVVEGVTTWGSLDATNGTCMVNYAGSIFVTIGGRVANFTQDGRLMDIWISRDDDVLVGRIGKVWHLTVMNNWLVAYLSGAGTTDRPTLWAFQDGSWHHLATLPNSGGSFVDIYSDFSCYYDRATQNLWAITPNAMTYRMYIPDYALNPYNDSSAFFMPRGWLEQARFFGGTHLLDKDFDGVTISGDNLSTNVHVKIYWQDEGSTAWELLGTADSDGEEVRWTSPYATRPQGKWVRLGVLLCSNDGDETPRVRAVTLRYLPMVTDRVQDTITVVLKDYIQHPGGDRDPYTLSQQLTHIKSLITSVVPVIYEDPLGIQYEVKVVGYSLTAPIFAFENSARNVKELEYNLVLRQISDGAFTG